MKTPWTVTSTTGRPWLALAQYSSILSPFYDHSYLGGIVEGQATLIYSQILGKMVQQAAKQGKKPYPSVKRQKTCKWWHKIHRFSQKCIKMIPKMMYTLTIIKFSMHTPLLVLKQTLEKLTREDASRAQSRTSSLKWASPNISQGRIAINSNPKWCARNFKIRRRRTFLKKYKTTSLISNLITPKEPQSMLCEHMESNRAKWTGRTLPLKNVECSHLCVWNIA